MFSGLHIEEAVSFYANGRSWARVKTELDVAGGTRAQASQCCGGPQPAGEGQDAPGACCG